jgi:hypothetical protein
MTSGTLSVLRRTIAAVTLCAFLPLATTACFGNFNLTRKIYRFNDTVSQDKWIEWLAFVVMVVVPVYSIGVLVDAILANSIEFWTGQNPIAMGETRTIEGEDGQLAQLTLREDGAIDVLITEADGATRQLRLVREDAAVAAYDADGRLIARAGNGVQHPALVGAGSR